MNGVLYNILLHVHSAGRWVVLLLLLIAIFNSLVAGGRPFIKSDNRTGLLLTSVADIMFLVGLVLWYFGPYGYEQIQNAGSLGVVMKDSTARFFAVEHITAMLIAIILIHIGKAQAKKSISDRAKHKRTVLYYLIALIIVLVSIPWPFMQSGAGRGWY